MSVCAEEHVHPALHGLIPGPCIPLPQNVYFAVEIYVQYMYTGACVKLAAPF